MDQGIIQLTHWHGVMILVIFPFLWNSSLLNGKLKVARCVGVFLQLWNTWFNGQKAKSQEEKDWQADASGYKTTGHCAVTLHKQLSLAELKLQNQIKSFLSSTAILVHNSTVVLKHRVLNQQSPIYSFLLVYRHISAFMWLSLLQRTSIVVSRCVRDLCILPIFFL